MPNPFKDINLNQDLGQPTYTEVIIATQKTGKAINTICNNLSGALECDEGPSPSVKLRQVAFNKNPSIIKTTAKTISPAPNKNVPTAEQILEIVDYNLDDDLLERAESVKKLKAQKVQSQFKKLVKNFATETDGTYTQAIFEFQLGVDGYAAGGSFRLRFHSPDLPTITTSEISVVNTMSQIPYSSVYKYPGGVDGSIDYYTLDLTSRIFQGIQDAWNESTEWPDLSANDGTLQVIPKDTASSENPTLPIFRVIIDNVPENGVSLVDTPEGPSQKTFEGPSEEELVGADLGFYSSNKLLIIPFIREPELTQEFDSAVLVKMSESNITPTTTLSFNFRRKSDADSGFYTTFGATSGFISGSDTLLDLENLINDEVSDSNNTIDGTFYVIEENDSIDDFDKTHQIYNTNFIVGVILANDDNPIVESFLLTEIQPSQPDVGEPGDIYITLLSSGAYCDTVLENGKFTLTSIQGTFEGGIFIGTIDPRTWWLIKCGIPCANNDEIRIKAFYNSAHLKPGNTTVNLPGFNGAILGDSIAKLVDVVPGNVYDLSMSISQLNGTLFIDESILLTVQQITSGGDVISESHTTFNNDLEGTIPTISIVANQPVINIIIQLIGNSEVWVSSVTLCDVSVISPPPSGSSSGGDVSVGSGSGSGGGSVSSGGGEPVSGDSTIDCPSGFQSLSYTQFAQTGFLKGWKGFDVKLDNIGPLIISSFYNNHSPLLGNQDKTDKLFYTTREGILASELDGSGLAIIVHGSGNSAAMDADSTAKHIYWSEITGNGGTENAIYRVDYSGANKVKLLSCSDRVYGLTLDLTNKYIYYVYVNLKEIRRIDLDGNNDTLIYSSDDLLGPRSIIYDQDTDYLFWIGSTTTTDGEVYKIRSDGAGVLKILDHTSEFDLINARSITIDRQRISAPRIYVATEATFSKTASLVKFNLTGGDFEKITLDDPYPNDGIEFNYLDRPNGLFVDTKSGLLLIAENNSETIFTLDRNDENFTALYPIETSDFYNIIRVSENSSSASKSFSSGNPISDLNPGDIVSFTIRIVDSVVAGIVILEIYDGFVLLSKNQITSGTTASVSATVPDSGIVSFSIRLESLTSLSTVEINEILICVGTGTSGELTCLATDTVLANNSFTSNKNGFASLDWGILSTQGIIYADATSDGLRIGHTTLGIVSTSKVRFAGVFKNVETLVSDNPEDIYYVVNIINQNGSFSSGNINLTSFAIFDYTFEIPDNGVLNSYTGVVCELILYSKVGPRRVEIDQLLVCNSRVQRCGISSAVSPHVGLKWIGTPRQPVNVYKTFIRYKVTNPLNGDVAYVNQISKNVSNYVGNCARWTQHGDNGTGVVEINPIAMDNYVNAPTTNNGTTVSVTPNLNRIWAIPIDGEGNPDAAIINYSAPQEDIIGRTATGHPICKLPETDSNFTEDCIIESATVFLLMNVIDPADESADGCSPDPATELEITFGYNRSTGARSFTKLLNIDDLYHETVDNTEGWDEEDGSNTSGEVARWQAIEFVLDIDDGQGLDQCYYGSVSGSNGSISGSSNPIIDIPQINGAGILRFDLLSLTGGEAFFNQECIANVIVATIQEGESQNEIQSVILPSASAGTYTLTVTIDGASGTTDPIPWNASVEQIRVKLGNLSVVDGTKNIGVTGEGTSIDPLLIEFKESLAAKNIDPIEADETNLIGTASAVFRTIRDGAVNERQQLSRTSSTQQNYTLEFNNQRTVSISSNETIDNVQSALEGLSTIGAGNILVTGNTTNREIEYSGELFFDFIGDFEGQNVPELVVDSTSDAYVISTKWSGGAGVDEIQELTVNASSGTFTITVYNPIDSSGSIFATTSAIAYNASSSTVRSAIAAAASWITISDINVTKPADNQWRITFLSGESYDVSSNVISAWKFEEESGDRLDSAGTLNLEPASLDTNLPSRTTGKVGNCVRMRKSNILFSNSTSDIAPLLTSSDYSMMFGINVEALQDTDGNSTENKFSFLMFSLLGCFALDIIKISSQLYKIRLFIQSSEADQVIIDTSETLSLNTWNLIGVVFDFSNGLVKINVNGGDFVQDSITGNFANSSSFKSIVFGLYNDTYDPITFKLDEAVFWNRALSQSETGFVYNSGSWKSYPFLATSVRDNIKQSEVNGMALGGGTFEIDTIQDGGGSSDQQRVTILNATNGTFALRINVPNVGLRNTSPIQWDTNSFDIKNAIVSINGIERADVIVAGNNPEFIVAFKASLGQIDRMTPITTNLRCNPVNLPPVLEGPYPYPVDRPGAGSPLPDDDLIAPLSDTANVFIKTELQRHLFDPNVKINDRRRTLRELVLSQGVDPEKYTPYLRLCDNSKLIESSFSSIVNSQENYVLIETKIDSESEKQRILGSISSNEILPSRFQWDCL